MEKTLQTIWLKGWKQDAEQYEMTVSPYVVNKLLQTICLCMCVYIRMQIHREKGLFLITLPAWESGMEIGIGVRKSEKTFIF